MTTNGCKKVPTQSRGRKKRPMPEYIDSSANSSKRSRGDFETFLHRGLCSNNPGMSGSPFEDAEDITFTTKELRAVKYPSHLNMICEPSKHEFKQTG